MLLVNSNAVAQNQNPLSGLSALSESDIQSSAIAFVNTTSSPGLEGATLEVDDTQRDSNQWRSSLGFTAEVTLKDYIFNGYWGLALVTGSLHDRIQLTADTGEPVRLDMTRDVTSLRGSLGLVFPVNQRFKLRSVLTLAVSDLQTNSIIDGILDNSNNPTVQTFDNNTQLASTAGSIDALSIGTGLITTSWTFQPTTT